MFLERRELRAEQGSEAFDGKNTKLWRSFHRFLVILPFFVPYSMVLPMVDEDRRFCETKMCRDRYLEILKTTITRMKCSGGSL